MVRYKLIIRVTLFTMVICTVIHLVYYTGRNPESIETTIPVKLAKILKLRSQLYSLYETTPSQEIRMLIRRTLDLLQAWPANQAKQDNVWQTPVSINQELSYETCNEKRRSVEEDEIYFNNVYEAEKCYHIPPDLLVTLIAYTKTCRKAARLLKRIRRIYPILPVIFAVASHKCYSVPGVKLYNVNDTASTWIRLANESRTKYVLVGRNMVEFTSHSDIDRMLRVMNSIENVKVVGGAVRLEPEGRWYAGCYQLTVHNFSIRIQPGHERSTQSCAYCDYIASPFLISRLEFLQKMNHSEMSGVIPFVDLFLKLTHSTDLTNELPPQFATVACVDVMFHVAGHKSPRGHGVAETGRDYWTPLARLWSVDRIRLPGGVRHQWACSEVGINCWSLRIFSSTLPVCCIHDLAKCVTGFLQLAQTYNVSIMITDNSALPSIKSYSGFLPWYNSFELYWDINQEKYIAGPIQRDLWNKYECKLGDRNPIKRNQYELKRCSWTEIDLCPYYSLKSLFWGINLNGIFPTRPIKLPSGLENPTQINIHGYWVVTDTNPGLAAKNRFGEDFLTHKPPIEITTQKPAQSIDIEVQPVPTKPCVSKKERHTCFNLHYLPMGNIQFQESD